METILNPKGAAESIAYLEAVNPDGTVSHRSGKIKNMITDYGLDYVGNQYTPNAWRYAVLGTGTTPVEDDSGTVTASQSTTTVTASGAIFAVGDIGKLIVWDTGEKAKITGFTSDTVVTVGTSQTVSADEFSMWRVNRTGLATEVKRTATYLTGAGNCGSSWASNVATDKRTYDFTAETGSVTYNEIAFAPAATGSVWAIALIPGGFSLVNEQQARIVYEVSWTYTPASSTSHTIPTATGWGADGDHSLCGYAGRSAVDTNGATTDGDFYGPFMNVGFAPNLILAKNTTVPALADSPTLTGAVAANTATRATYVSGNYYNTLTSVWNVATGNASDWRCIACGGNPSYMFVFDAAQTKLNTQKLTISFKFSWDRIITNS